MPTYDYICKECAHNFEAFQKMTDDPLSVCPECGGEVERKIGGGAGLLFKGSGFYITDYKGNKSQSKKSEPAEKADKGEKKEKPKAPQKT